MPQSTVQITIKGGISIPIIFKSPNDMGSPAQLAQRFSRSPNVIFKYLFVLVKKYVYQRKLIYHNKSFYYFNIILIYFSGLLLNSY